ncbi:endo alpha-1,4 polygalactosaminidase [bacterium]|nr:endo alpha-1,4 polygalactosaminidase [bacterium]
MNWAERGLLGLALMHMGCTQPQSSQAPSRWQGVKTFACQLQELNIAQAAGSPFQLLLMDYSRDGRFEGRYTAAELSQLRQGGRLLVAYLSVGEAESYRSYWNKSWKPGHPSWLDKPNPNWEGNYKVRYWDPDWQKILFDYADLIVDQGYDGLFLDVVDGYEYWQGQRPQAAAEMRDLIKKLAGHLRQRGDLGLFLNGGEGLVDDAQLLESITGLVKEEIFFGLNGDGKATPPQFRRNVQAQLSKVVQSGKLVLSIDYTQNPQQARQAHQQARQAGYLEFVGVRALDRLVEQPE